MNRSSNSNSKRSLRRNFFNNHKNNTRRRGRRRNGLIENFRRMTVVAPLTVHCPLPMELRTKFTASGYFEIAAASTAISMHFKLNSCYLPFTTTNTSGAVTWNNLTIGTFQPAGFTSLVDGTKMYGGFIVQSALFEFDFVPQSVQDSIVMTGCPAQSAGVPASVGAAMTRPWTKQMAFASGRQYRLGDYPFRHKVLVSKFLGIPKLLYDNDVSGNFVGGGTGDPPALLPYTVNIETGDAAGLTLALEGRVRIIYFTLLRSLSTDTMATS